MLKVLGVTLAGLAAGVAWLAFVPFRDLPEAVGWCVGLSPFAALIIVLVRNKKPERVGLILLFACAMFVGSCAFALAVINLYWNF